MDKLSLFLENSLYYRNVHVLVSTLDITFPVKDLWLNHSLLVYTYYIIENVTKRNQ
jgi:hypothetical protein